MTLPITNAAGTVKHFDQARRLARAPVAEVVIGSYTVEPRDGNPGNVYASRDGVALNALGMPNPGMAHLRYYADDFAALDKPIVVSIAGFCRDDYAALASECRWAYAVEVNLGCPNVWVQGTQHRIGSFDPAYVQRILEAVQDALNDSNAEVRVKLSPFSDPALLVEVAEAAHDADAIVASNTFPNGWLPDALDVPYGGVSGAAMKAIVLGQVRQFAAATECPIIAAGGVRTGADVADYQQAGAVAVQVASRYLDGGENPDVFVTLASAALEQNQK